MKISALESSARSTDLRSIYVTEPPLNKELLDYLFEHHWDETRRAKFATKEGRLIFTGRSAMSPEQIRACEEWLTKAETELSNQKASEEQTRKAHLQASANKSGLPLTQPPIADSGVDSSDADKE